MAEQHTLGQKGEDAAVAYLERNGYLIRERNWRKGHLEIDIVAAKEGELVIVEVKTRTTTEYQEPEEAVNALKIRRIVRAADAYIKQHAIDAPVRFDIITATGSADHLHLEHIRDAFYPPMF
ncbi:MAG: YraN family protein [Bacteroides sp.]|nr:YraN family protein [Bacteroides sp.]